LWSPEIFIANLPAEPPLGVAPKMVQDIARSIVAINRDEKVCVPPVE
jgi:branched-chain amino acid transport system ATP-binding protein